MNPAEYIYIPSKTERRNLTFL